MHFQVKITENGRKNIFRDKKTKKQDTVDLFSC